MTRRAFRLGLTGSIGMGKSTTAKMFAEEGLPVWDADAAVHRLYASSGAAVAAMRDLHPQAVGPAGVDRTALKVWIAEDQTALGQIEAVVHPLVAMDREDFLSRTDADIVVLDIPLLFETGGEKNMDAVAVVSASVEDQRARVLARPGMTETHFQAILDKQMPDAEKRRRADYVIETLTMDAARDQVRAVIADIQKRIRNA